MEQTLVNRDFQYFVWPILRVSGVNTMYGIRSVLQALFDGDKLIPTNPEQLAKNECLFSFAEQLYTAICPLAAVSQSVIVPKEKLEKSEKMFVSLVNAASQMRTKEISIGNVVADVILSIAQSLKLNAQPFSPIGVSFTTDPLYEEALSYCFKSLRIPERYLMSPPPEKPMYYSTPIYYVNGVPHIGHVFTTTLTECISSWYKMRGIDCIYSTGTDEHGIKVQTTAQANGVEPIEWCDKTSNAFREAFKHFDLHPDVFIRTTEDRHKEAVYKLWNILLEKEYIYQGKYEGWYSKREETFIPENQVQEVVVNGETKHINTEDGAELFWTSETNWMFKLSAMQQPILDWLNSNPDCITPRQYYNQVKSMVSAGLNDLSVSRQTVKWGFPVPNDPSQTIYVWIDALTNYLTVAGWDGENMGRWPCDVHVIGKDILKFHAIYWPGFLIAAGIKPFMRLLVHGWWTVQNNKMSKSLGNTLDPYVLSSKWGLEPLKYYLLREATLVSDSDYSDSAMLARYNNDLADVLANLVLRIISEKLHPSMIVPEPDEMAEDDESIVEDIFSLPATIDHYMHNGQTKLALEVIFDKLHVLNKYFTDKQLWNLKNSDQKRYDTVLYVLCECLRIIAICLKPFIPKTSLTILEGLGYNESRILCFDEKEHSYYFRSKDEIKIAQVYFAKSETQHDKSNFPSGFLEILGDKFNKYEQIKVFDSCPKDIKEKLELCDKGMNKSQDFRVLCYNETQKSLCFRRKDQKLNEGLIKTTNVYFRKGDKNLRIGQNSFDENNMPQSLIAILKDKVELYEEMEILDSCPKNLREKLIESNAQVKTLKESRILCYNETEKRFYLRRIDEVKVAKVYFLQGVQELGLTQEKLMEGNFPRNLVEILGDNIVRYEEMRIYESCPISIREKLEQCDKDLKVSCNLFKSGQFQFGAKPIYGLNRYDIRVLCYDSVEKGICFRREDQKPYDGFITMANVYFRKGEKRLYLRQETMEECNLPKNLIETLKSNIDRYEEMEILDSCPENLREILVQSNKEIKNSIGVFKFGLLIPNKKLKKVKVLFKSHEDSRMICYNEKDRSISIMKEDQKPNASQIKVAKLYFRNGEKRLFFKQETMDENHLPKNLIEVLRPNNERYEDLELYDTCPKNLRIKLEQCKEELNSSEKRMIFYNEKEDSICFAKENQKPNASQISVAIVYFVKAEKELDLPNSLNGASLPKSLIDVFQANLSRYEEIEILDACPQNLKENFLFVQESI